MTEICVIDQSLEMWFYSVIVIHTYDMHQSIQ